MSRSDIVQQRTVREEGKSEEGNLRSEEGKGSKGGGRVVKEEGDSELPFTGDFEVENAGDSGPSIPSRTGGGICLSST